MSEDSPALTEEVVVDVVVVQDFAGFRRENPF